jgi:hypothetical protein
MFNPNDSATLFPPQLSKNEKMKRITIALLLLSCFEGCKKDNTSWITATVIEQGCYPNSWIVQIDYPNEKRQTFLCGPSVSSISSALINCGNAAVILDMPPSLAQAGKKVKFSKWSDKGLLCFSSTMSPHHLEVRDLSPL